MPTTLHDPEPAVNRSLVLGFALGSLATAAVFPRGLPDAPALGAQEPLAAPATRVYENTLTPIANPRRSSLVIGGSLVLGHFPERVK